MTKKERISQLERDVEGLRLRVYNLECETVIYERQSMAWGDVRLCSVKGAIELILDKMGLKMKKSFPRAEGTILVNKDK